MREVARGQAILSREERRQSTAVYTTFIGLGKKNLLLGYQLALEAKEHRLHILCQARQCPQR